MDHNFVTGLMYYSGIFISFLSVHELVCIELQGREASANCPLLHKIWSMLQIWAPSSRRSSREKHNVGHGVYLGREHIRLHAVARLNYRTKTQSGCAVYGRRSRCADTVVSSWIDAVRSGDLLELPRCAAESHLRGDLCGNTTACTW